MGMYFTRTLSRPLLMPNSSLMMSAVELTDFLASFHTFLAFCAMVSFAFWVLLSDCAWAEVRLRAKTAANKHIIFLIPYI